jgi:NAD(P)-dependent dehydrogenase (short-subunit alcohol dehydrogenase family)
MKVVISASGIGFEVAKILGERGDQVFSQDVDHSQVKLKAAYVAIQLLDSQSSRLIFDETIWHYIFGD